MLAALARGLVERAIADDAEPIPAIDPELLDASLWHAARDGMTDQLVCDGRLVPALVAVEELLKHAVLSAADHSFISERLFTGTGADRQRDAFAEAGVEGLGTLAH